MQNITPIDTGTTAGTIGGTFTCILCAQNLENMVQASFHAAIGAIVSFIVSVGLKYVLRKLRAKL
jgi:hypothetical protein